MKSKKTIRVLTTAVAVAAFLSGLIGPVAALANYTTIQNLSFGDVLLKNNNSVQSVTVNTNGTYSSSSNIVILSPPTPGIYQVNGLTPSAHIQSVDVTVSQTLHCACSSEDYDMDDFHVDAPDTDITGSTTVTVGARAKTSGDTGGYPDGSYSGSLDLVFNF